ncbi:hypothetical protein CDO87_03565 [Sagittula sp. P11]|uniref:hypothetical protein n=1 Tax=Sagittula sp. P11 TaxID=2009329 RepID=UPI000C2D1D2E|nr:hypothetical protein [Sagittula sp. P11]AUC52322.1 hypothetical protein CDO87_03565 [Sagittula sp. P11]
MTKKPLQCRNGRMAGPHADPAYRPYQPKKHDPLSAPVWAGLQIKQVPAGTVIEHDGQKLEVTETQAVQKAGALYMTAAQIGAMGAFCKEKPNG